MNNDFFYNFKFLKYIFTQIILYDFCLWFIILWLSKYVTGVAVVITPYWYFRFLLVFSVWHSTNEINIVKVICVCVKF
jgi:hypothetical protein